MRGLAARLAWFLAPAMFVAMIALNPPGRPTYLMGDFRAFYCAGSAIAHGANPYLVEPLRTCENNAGPPQEPAFLRGVALPAPLPPAALALFVPLSLLPFPLAAGLYGALLLASMSLSVLLFSRITGATNLALNLSLAAITATVTYYVGQPVPFALLALAGAAQYLREGRWIAASLCAVAATIEPHVALPAIAGMAIALPRTRLPLAAALLAVGLGGVWAVGLQTSIAYARDVLPAHAFANAFEWQFSLTSLLTSLGVGPLMAIRLGEVMFAGMTALGIWIAMRIMRATGDRAVMVFIAPAFAMFGGVHVHFQQIVVAFPAIMYVFVRLPQARALAGGGLGLAMIPWNVMGASLLAGLAPLLVGTFCAMTIGRRAGLLFSTLAACIVLSLLVLANLGLGPAQAHLVAHQYAGGALAESSWSDFSHAALMRPSIMMQWLRIPTLVGLACGLAAIAWMACAPTNIPAEEPLCA